MRLTELLLNVLTDAFSKRSKRFRSMYYSSNSSDLQIQGAEASSIFQFHEFVRVAMIDRLQTSTVEAWAVQRGGSSWDEAP